MNAVAISVDTVSSSVISTVEFNVVTSTLNTTVEATAQSNMPEISIKDLNANSTGISFTNEISDIERWSAEKGQRFRELALNESLGELSIADMAELEALTHLRRSEKYPRSADEILWHRRQQNVTKSLVQALQTYVEFHEPSRHT
jgi:hypothetical protein